MSEPQIAPAATMQAVRYLGPRREFELRRVSIPQPGAGQVRVKIAACGVCRTELHLRDGLLDLGRRDFTVGHEIAGTVDALGQGVDLARLGQRVVVYYYEGCGHCAYCRVGEEHLCPAPLAQPGFSSDGGYAEYLVVRAQNCVPIPANIGFPEVAPMGCAGSTAVHAGKMARIRPGEWVAIQGFGGVGLAAMQYAAKAGARTIAIGLGAEKLAIASKLGATAVIDAAAEPDVARAVATITGDGADVVFELVGTTASMKASVQMLRRRGRLILVGYTAEQLEIHPIEIIVRELQILGSVGSSLQDLHDVVALMAEGAITSVIDRTLPLADFAAALSAVERQATIGRLVLEL